MFNLFYRDTRLLILSIAVIAVAGLSSFFVLPRLEDPTLRERFAVVNTPFPGATADRVESLVTQRLEEELQEVEELKEIRSTSLAGMSTLVLELRDDVTSVGEIWSRVRDKLDDAQPLFPPGAGEPDIDLVTTKAYASIVALTWTQDDQPNYAILLRQAEELEARLRALPGTEEIETFGDPEEEISVELQPAQLAALGLTAADVARQLESSDAKLSAGQLRGTNGDILMEVDSELTTIDRIAATPIQFGTQGRFARLGDIAHVRKGIAQPPRSLSLIDGQPAVTLGALVRSDHRLDIWNDQAQNVIAQFSSELPPGLKLTNVFEQSTYVETRLSSLLWNLLVGGLAVVTVILFVMGWRSALIVGAALPLSALMVLTGMRILGIPMHQMSVTGLIIALGLLIDNAIVMVDEVKERLHEGHGPTEAVSRSVRHLLVPLLGSTLTTALAFAPIALMPGAAGEFVGSIAISVMLAIGSSFLLAMTVIPALAALASRWGASANAQAWWNSGFSQPWLTALYRRTLDQIFRRPVLGVVLAAVLPVLGFMQARHLPEQFFPPADRDQFQIELELAPQASLGATLEAARQTRELAMAHPEVEGVDWFLGESAPTFYYNLIRRRENTSRYAQAIVHLKSAENVQPLIHKLQRELDAELPEARVLVRQLEQGPPFDAPVEVQLFGPDVHKLRELGEQVRAELAAIDEVVHTRSDLEDDRAKLSLVIDEHQARLAGLDHAAIARQLAATTEGALGGTVLEETEELPVRVRLPDQQRADLSAISSLDLVSHVTSPDVHQSTIPLTALGEIQLKPEVSAVTRLNNRRMNEVKAYVQAGVLPSVVVTKLEQRLEAANFELPPGYTLKFGGEADKRDQAVGNLMSSVGVLMVLMVATLVLSFSSFRAAALIGLVGALSVGLGLGALWLFGYPFGFMAIVGTMGLVGVAINDAIVVLAALREDEQARAGNVQAVRDVVVRSTRHILATTVTTVAGFVPLVLAGGGFWPPLAVSIAGGVVGATMLALYFVPAAHIMVVAPAKAWAFAWPNTQRAPAVENVAEPAFDINDSVDGPLPLGV